MRFRMGKGQVLVFDAFIEKTIEAMRAELGYYPPLKRIGERCTPPQPANCVHRALNRLAAAGRLSQEARLVYNAKNNLQIEKENNTNEKTIKNSKIKSRSKAAKK
jgi:hypothetical protein